MWVSFSSSGGDHLYQVVVGVTPLGQSTVMFLQDGVDISVRGYELSGVFCTRPGDVGGHFDLSKWSCEVYIPWHYLPSNINWHQVTHRVPAVDANENLVTETYYSCPNVEGEGIDFTGCPVDSVLFVDPEYNAEDKSYWEAAKNAANQPEPETDAGANAVASLALAVVSVVIAVMA